MSQPVRRVVTGHDPDGKAVFVSDSLVEPITTVLSATAFHQLWGGDNPPELPDDGASPPTSTYFPPVGGFRFNLFTLPPANKPPPGPEVDVGAALAELHAALPGLFDYNESAEPGMHTTPTIDFEVVLSGEVVLELDDGATVHLGPGDTVVQNGTRHRWSNPGDIPATLAVFICGAHHAGVAWRSSSDTIS
ncbi:MAG: cupin domain-containing protein [Acidimicrobiales bacterium]